MSSDQRKREIIQCAAKEKKELEFVSRCPPEFTRADFAFEEISSVHVKGT